MNRIETSQRVPQPAPRAWKVALTTLVVAVAAALSVNAIAQPHGGGREGGWGMEHGMMGGSPERVGRMMDHMLDGLNATDAQRSQIKQIAQAAAADLKSQREAGRDLRERSMQILTAPTVDANAAEATRQQMMAQHDATSRRMTQAMVDISRVLTPEQRAKVGERMKERSARMQEHMQRRDREPAQK